jgi:hypothetical protein
MELKATFKASVCWMFKTHQRDILALIYKSIPVVPGSLKSEDGKQQLCFYRKILQHICNPWLKAFELLKSVWH